MINRLHYEMIRLYSGDPKRIQHFCKVHIQQLIGTNYARLRMGIGNDFPRGAQIDWVLGRYSDEDMKQLQPAIDTAVEMIKSFVLAGIDITMNQYNKLGKK